jgi:hypothetical protein
MPKIILMFFNKIMSNKTTNMVFKVIAILKTNLE